jgi:tagatose 6-phosphate kinase
MILVVGPTPSLQRRMIFSRIKLNEVNRALKVEQLASGKGVNCTRAVLRLGGNVKNLLFLGGLMGSLFGELLKEEEIPFRAIQTKSSTRSCCTIAEMDNSFATELIEVSKEVSSAEIKKFFSEFQKIIPKCRALVCIGTLPPGAPNDFYAQLIRIAHRFNVTTVVDAQGKALLEAAKAKPHIVKPNRDELSIALGMDCRSQKNLLKAVQRLKSLGSQSVLITDKERPALFLDRDGKVRKILPPRVQLKNPLGSGDSVSAGIAFAMTQNINLYDAVIFGLACGSANAASQQGYGFLDRKMVHDFIAKF